MRPREPELILQIRENNPTTGIQLVEAAKLTLDFGRPDEAKKYLAKAIELKMDDARSKFTKEKFGIIRLTTTNGSSRRRQARAKLSCWPMKKQPKILHGKPSFWQSYRQIPKKPSG
ncbi:MAG: hypothetical protein U0894_02835 [Pirellulales bacterium]